MSRWQFVFRSLFAFWRINLAVCLGVIAATAVLSGALLVGDSMRGSLRKIAVDGLGEIDEILITDRFFQAQLLTENLSSNPEFAKEFFDPSAVILFPNASALYKTSNDQQSVANKVTLIGCNDSFWELAGQEKKNWGTIPSFDQLESNATSTPIVINEPLADDLGIDKEKVGGETDVILTIQIPKPQLINADNPIGKKEDLYETIARLRVAKIIPAKSIGRFSLHPTQLLPRILFVPIQSVQEALGQLDQANTILISARDRSIEKTGTSAEQSERLNEWLRPSARDLGLIFKNVAQKYTPEDGEENTIFQYISLSSDQLLLSDRVVEIATGSLDPGSTQPVMTYLANGLSISNDDGTADETFETIPFSMVSGIEIGSDFPLKSAIDGETIKSPAADEIVINEWAANDFLNTLPEYEEQGGSDPERYRSLIGRQLSVDYFEPEATHGKLVPQTVVLRISDIAKMTHPKTPFNRRRSATFDRPPTLANDPDLTPFVPGVTDQNSVNKWDLPFKTDVRPQDDDYWQFYRTTPKAFVDLSLARELWKSRFGTLTSLRIKPTGSSKELELRLLQHADAERENFGFQFTPIRRRNVAASSGSTPFDVLFLALSFFIIASALILIALLFRLGVEQKSVQTGLLNAVGMTRGQILRMLVIEGAIVSIVGAVLGIAVGIGYAQLMVYGLQTWWVGAVMTSFMEFFWTPQSLVIGLLVGVLVSLATIWITLRRMQFLSVRDLLNGKTQTHDQLQDGQSPAGVPRWLGPTATICFVLAVGLLILAATSLGGEAQAGAFMGGGFLMLSALLTRVWARLNRLSPAELQLSSNQLAAQNTKRNPVRSTLTIGLVAVATFLIVAVSSFHLTPTEEGTGGFAYLAESSRPVVGDFQDPQTRENLLRDQAPALQNLEVYSLRLLPGDEAGCNNPFQAQRPKILGMGKSFVRRFDDKEKKGFAWAASMASSEQDRINPWRLLEAEQDDDAIPVVIDKNTAMYSLKIFGVGGTYDVTLEDGRKLTFRVVGFLSNSTLQGSLIISEEQFLDHFPSVTGYRVFLMGSSDPANPITEAQIASVENELSPYGFDATSSMSVLDGFLAVQNTYLSTFQTLGAFGLLLGTFGLATVQLRNVVERRKELGVMRAIGFSRAKIGEIILSEHSGLLISGMVVGLVAALFSVVPHWLFGDARIPLLNLAMILGGILLVGLISGLGAVYASVKSPILTVLRAEN